jgi:hypothetical protein
VFQSIQSTPRCIPATHFGPKRAGDRKPGSRVTFWSKPNRRQETGHQGQHLANNWTAQACQYRIQQPDSLSTGPTGQPVNGNNQTACQLDQTDSPSATIIGQPRLSNNHQLDSTSLPVFGQHQPVKQLSTGQYQPASIWTASACQAFGQDSTACLPTTFGQHQPVKQPINWTSPTCQYSDSTSLSIIWPGQHSLPATIHWTAPVCQPVRNKPASTIQLYSTSLSALIELTSTSLLAPRRSTKAANFQKPF